MFRHLALKHAPLHNYYFTGARGIKKNLTDQTAHTRMERGYGVDPVKTCLSFLSLSRVSTRIMHQLS